MTEEDQITADWRSSLPEGSDAVANLPSSIADTMTYVPEEDEFDKSQRFLHGQGSEDQKRIAEVQAAQDRLSKLLSMYHGDEPKNAGGLRSQVDRGEISPSDYFAMTGRIYAGGTGDTAQRDARGNITGYTSPDGSGSALGGPSATPGLDAFHEMNPDAPSSPGFSFMPEPSMSVPHSVAAHVGAPLPGLASAVDTLTLDTRLQAPTAQSIHGSPTRFASPRPGEVTAQKELEKAGATLRAQYKAAGLPDPTIRASVIKTPGGSLVAQGNMGARPNGYPRMPGSIWG